MLYILDPKPLTGVFSPQEVHVKSMGNISHDRMSHGGKILGGGIPLKPIVREPLLQIMVPRLA